MAKLLIKKGDEVQVIRGAESGRRTAPPEGAQGANPRGERGRVRKVLPRKGRVIVEGVRIVKKTVRPNPAKGIRGGFVEREAPIPVSNVMLVCRKCDRPVRVRLGTAPDGKRARLCRRCGEVI